jgi:hypothetical protein
MCDVALVSALSCAAVEWLPHMKRRRQAFVLGTAAQQLLA